MMRPLELSLDIWSLALLLQLVLRKSLLLPCNMIDCRWGRWLFGFLPKAHG